MSTNANRVQIPANLIELTNTDFSKELRLYTDGYEIFIDNTSENYTPIPCFGIINLDNKNRFVIPKTVFIPLKYTCANEVYFYVLDHKICLKCESD